MFNVILTGLVHVDAAQHWFDGQTVTSIILYVMVLYYIYYTIYNGIIMDVNIPVSNNKYKLLYVVMINVWCQQIFRIKN